MSNSPPQVSTTNLYPGAVLKAALKAAAKAVAKAEAAYEAHEDDEARRRKNR
jgi:hypothetical protein